MPVGPPSVMLVWPLGPLEQSAGTIGNGHGVVAVSVTVTVIGVLYGSEEPAMMASLSLSNAVTSSV